MDFDKEYFSKYYSDYFKQNPPYKLKSYLNLLLKHVNHGVLLDIGCSYGLFVEIANEHFTCYGMDMDFDVVSEAGKRVPHASFLTGILPNIPLKYVNVITLLDVIEHVADLETTFGALKDILRPRGVVLVVVPVYDGPLGWLVKKLDVDSTHIHKCSRTFWLNLTQNYFDLVEWKGVFRRLLFRKYYLHLTTSLLRRMSPAIIIVLRKKNEKQYE